MAQAVVFHILLNNKGHGKYSLLSGLLFDDGEQVSVPVPDNITGTEAKNIADTQAETCFRHKGIIIHRVTCSPVPLRSPKALAGCPLEETVFPSSGNSALPLRRFVAALLRV